jgi:hypothetical protein
MGLSLKNNAGVTLVEALVATIIAAVVGAVMLTIIYLNGRQVSASMRTMKLCMGYDIAVSQIGKTCRAARFITRPGDTGWPPNANGAATTTTIYMRGSTGDTIGGYTISGTSLKEWDTAAKEFIGLKISPTDSIRVTSVPPSNFILSQSRKNVTVNLQVVALYSGVPDTFRSVREMFLCRNP